jgi:hypothetical protein
MSGDADSWSGEWSNGHTIQLSVRIESQPATNVLNVTNAWEIE